LEFFEFHKEGRLAVSANRRKYMIVRNDCTMVTQVRLVVLVVVLSTATISSSERNELKIIKNKDLIEYALYRISVPDPLCVLPIHDNNSDQICRTIGAGTLASDRGEAAASSLVEYEDGVGCFADKEVYPPRTYQPRLVGLLCE